MSLSVITKYDILLLTRYVYQLKLEKKFLEYTGQRKPNM